VYLNRFERGGAAENLETAAYHYRQAIRSDRANGLAYIQLAAVLRKQAKPAEADELLQEATRQWEETLRWNPKSARAHFNMGQLLMANRKPSEAEPHFRAAGRFDLAERAAAATENKRK
jgi:Tfp pilus assembly protein PilF